MCAETYSTPRTFARSVRPDAPPTLIDARDRFLAKLEEGETPPEHFGVELTCLNFTGFLNPDGYGHFRVSAISSSPLLAHVFAYMLFVGDLAPGEQVHHRCENRRCCRPEHLEAKARGRHLAEHNRTRRGNGIVETRQEERDGQIYTVNVFASAEPRRKRRGRHTRAVAA